MLSRFTRAVRRHGAARALALAIALITVNAGKWLDRRLRHWPSRRARIARDARALSAGRSVEPSAFDAYVLEETIKSLSASSRYCYERWLTLWLHRWLLPPSIRPSFYGEPIAAAASRVGARPRVLAVGCRDELELMLLTRALPSARVVGLDLFSWHRRIVRGDMHALPFTTGAFDLVVSRHSLEHAWNVDDAASEMLRVTAAGGVIAIEVPVKTLVHAVPQRQGPGAMDRWDFSNLSALRGTFAGAGSHELHELFALDSSSRVRHLQWVACVAPYAPAAAKR